MEALPFFLEAYEHHYADYSSLYAGVREALGILMQQDIKMACVTNKIARFTEPLLQVLKISHYFDVVVSGDTCQHLKPHPESLYYAARMCNVLVAQSIFVGDSLNDVEAARNAQMKVVAVTYGYNHGQDIRDSKPDAVIDSLLELVH
jgi:phosphoglycolate phosphatase